jgi:plastocyanin
VSDDKPPTVNRANNREGLLLPVLFPVGILAGIAVILFGFSRILLYVTKHAATGIALATAVTIMVVCSFVANRKKLSGAALFPMVGGIAGIVLLLGGVAMLAAQKQEGGGGPPAITVALVAPPTASAKGFDTKTLSFVAGAPTNLTFDNQEPSVQHNVVIFQGTSDSGPQVFSGALLTGPAKTTYRVPALAAGTYYFHCEVHPTTMFGTITVAAGGGGGSSLDITAANVQFNTDKLTEATPNTATKLVFTNKDAGTPHDFALYKDSAYTQVLFSGDQITGPASTTYDLPALAPGTYYFHCTVHPTTMTGTLVVGGTAAPPSGGASPSASATGGASPSG